MAELECFMLHSRVNDLASNKYGLVVFTCISSSSSCGICCCLGDGEGFQVVNVLLHQFPILFLGTNLIWSSWKNVGWLNKNPSACGQLHATAVHLYNSVSLYNADIRILYTDEVDSVV